MRQALLAAAGALALALGPMTAAPSQAADTKDILGALLGIAAVAAIANEVRKENEAARRETVQSNRQVWRNDDWRRSEQRHERRNRHARVLPGQCLRVADTRHGDGIVFPERCLNRAGIGAGQLPRRCETRLRTRNGPLDVYRARCLADAGWSLPRIASAR